MYFRPSNKTEPQAVQIIWSPNRMSKHVVLVLANGRTEFKKSFAPQENDAIKAYARQLADEMGLPLKG